MAEQVKNETINQIISDVVRARVQIATDEEIKLAKLRLEKAIQKVTADVALDVIQNQDLMSVANQINIFVDTKKNG